MAFGSVGENSDALVQVGYTIVDALARAGLQVEWDGRARSRILVGQLEWRRRRP
jgi:hypothetical protein